MGVNRIGMEDGLCCPSCSTEDCLIIHPKDTTKCPSCGNVTLVNSAEMMARIRQLHRMAIEAVGLKIIEKTE